MDIGQRVREVREDLGMQRTVLARRVGVAENTIYRIETGKRTPSVELLEKIARELRTEPAEFLREPVPLDEASETGPDIALRARSVALRQWEQGHKAIARAIADAFGFSVADLMEEPPASLAEAPQEESGPKVVTGSMHAKVDARTFAILAAVLRGEVYEVIDELADGELSREEAKERLDRVWEPILQ